MRMTGPRIAGSPGRRACPSPVLGVATPRRGHRHIGFGAPLIQNGFARPKRYSICPEFPLESRATEILFELEMSMAAYGTITADELKGRLGEVALFDVRGPGETNRGVIEGANLVPLHMVPMSVERFRDAGKDVVVYCHSGARSAQACQFLAQQGVERIFNLEGGVMYWAGSGLPLVEPSS